MAQPGDLARVGDDHVGVDDGRVVLRVSTGIEGGTSTYRVFYVGTYHVSLHLVSVNEWKCGIFPRFLSSSVRNRNSTCCRG